MLTQTDFAIITKLDTASGVSSQRSALLQDQAEQVLFYTDFDRLVRPTLQQSRPNKTGLKCPSVHPSVHSQKVSLISMKFGM